MKNPAGAPLQFVGAGIQNQSDTRARHLKERIERQLDSLHGLLLEAGGKTRSDLTREGLRSVGLRNHHLSTARRFLVDAELRMLAFIDSEEFRNAD